MTDIIKNLNLDSMSLPEQVKLLSSIEKALLNSKVRQKELVKTNTDLVLLSLKKIRNDIEDKFNFFEQSFNDKAAKIEGRPGKDGYNGKDGPPGPTGLDGKNGKDGRDGRDGRDGVDGKDGVSVTDAKIDFDGSLVITLSTGQELNVGEVVAPDLSEKIKVISTMSTNGAVAILDEGTSITSGVKTINFVGASVTATNSGDDVTVNVSAGTGTVTSVAATVPSFLSVSGSPITTSGILAITLSGTALPIANGGTGATTLAGASIATYSGTETLTNKRIDPRVTSAASASSLTPDISVSDVYAYTALAAGLTINAPTGTPLDGDKLIFRLLDNGTSQSLNWNATYTAIGVTLPTSTTASKTTYVGCIYNADNTRWDAIAVTTQA